jgi:hypothetical protein
VNVMAEASIHNAPRALPESSAKAEEKRVTP